MIIEHSIELVMSRVIYTTTITLRRTNNDHIIQRWSFDQGEARRNALAGLSEYMFRK